MAARENQGYLVAIILLVLLSVVLAIATYFGFTNLGDVSDRLDNLQGRYDNEKKAQTAYMEQAAILKSYLGLEGLGDDYSMVFVPSRLETIKNLPGQDAVISETQTITDTYNADMGRYVSKDEGEEGTWRGLVDDFAAALNENYNTIQVQKNTFSLAEAQFTKDLAEKDATIKTTQSELEKAQGDLTSERALHAKKEQENTAQLNKLNQSLTDRMQDIDTLNTDLETTQKRYEQELLTRQDAIDALKERLKQFDRPQTEVADGQIISITPLLGKVWINLGYDDNLLPQQTFAVYDQQDTTFESGRHKAKIEVTRITDPHMAEARIIDQDNINPILTKDFISTPVWEPGYSVPLALAGTFDLDGDGRSDLQRLISIIQRNGGKVVAFHDEEGNVTGQIDEHTRYFVKGEEPRRKELADAYSQLDMQRKQFEVREKSIQELLNAMGFNSEAKIQRFEDKQKRFTPRQPGTAAGSAFDDDK